MRSFLCCILYVFISASILEAGRAEYYLVDEYFTKYPEQFELSQNFTKIVKRNSVKTSSKTAKPVKIVMVYPGNQISDYWRKSKISFEKRLKELDIKYELKDHFSKPAVELKEQAKSITKAIKEDTDYLIFTLDAKKHKVFIQKILLLKRPKLILQNITTPLKSWDKHQPFLYVGFDHVQGAKKLADYYIKRYGKKAKYAVLYGPKGYVSDMRGKEFIGYISKNSKMKLLEEYYTDFNKQKAYKAVIDLLDRHKEGVDFIYACSTDISLGAIEALKAKGYGSKIAVNGWGGGESELKAIMDGSMDVTVMRMNDDNGVAMAEAIKLDIEGSLSKVPTVFSGDLEIITKQMDYEDMDLLKSKAFRYSGLE